MSSRTTDDALRRLLDEGRVRAAAIDADHARLWEALASATEGGKRFRPALLTATHDALGGDSTFAALEVGAAVELLHTAFVIHDDVIDGDHVRRGRPNVSGTFRAQALGDGAGASEADGYGRTAAILAGDLALTTAVRAVATCGAPVDVVHRLLDLFDAALHTTAAGELADVRLTLDLAPASLSESVAMEAKQDGRLLLLAPPAGRCRARRRRRGHGRPSGRGGSGAGDRLPARGRPHRRLRRLLALREELDRRPAHAQADAAAGPREIHHPVGADPPPYLGRDLDDEELAEVRRLLTASGSRRFVEELAEAQVTTARSIFDGLGFSIDFLDTMTTRPSVLVDGSEVAA